MCQSTLWCGNASHTYFVKLDRHIFRRHKGRFGTRDPDKLRLATIKLSDRVTKATRLASKGANREDQAGRRQGHL